MGGFDKGMQNLAERGLIPVLNAKVLEAKTPIIGLCLGMQLFSRRSEEGQLPGLGWLEAETVRFNFDEAQATLKVPHMGWNTVRACRPHPLLGRHGPRAALLTSSTPITWCPPTAPASSGETHYGYDFTSAMAHDNVLGVQFHPEKSHRFGMRLLKNFARAVLTPCSERASSLPCC